MIRLTWNYVKLSRCGIYNAVQSGYWRNTFLEDILQASFVLKISIQTIASSFFCHSRATDVWDTGFLKSSILTKLVQLLMDIPTTTVCAPSWWTGWQDIVWTSTTINVQLLTSDVVACHVLPAKRDERLMPVIVNFLNDAVKREVMMGSNNLNEQLTQTMLPSSRRRGLWENVDRSTTRGPTTAKTII